ncbi:spore coat U domain-containing protein [uncultured Pluralibacter sp.]|uniref:Csu type fimbrial protein n=1 Tax=uncultured Pluralibacter sp. TaxID=1490864 RepID=UPI00261380FB|nr:spore coat U domain-containing protein [uncultured Pluralibacter sp.]
MKKMNNKSPGVICAALALMLAPGVYAAGTLTGKIGVQLVIGAGCTVNNNSTSEGSNNWGTLDFGTHSSLNSIIDGTVTGSNGSSGITINCSEGLTPTLTLDAGQNGSGNVRNLSAGSGDTLIPYRLYSDSARTSIINPNAPITLADSTQDLPVYGRVVPEDQRTPSPAAGTYNDIVIATLAW